MAAGRIDTVGQIEGLLGIALHDGLPAIVRASAMDLLAPVSSPAIAAETEPALSDPDPQVRVAAVALQRGAPQTDLAQRLVPLLSDPVRAVRIATAREFLALRIAHMPADTTAALNSAMTEWQRSIRNKMDFPEMQMVMGGIGLTTRNMMAALSAFGEAVDMDPQMIEAWTMIVRIHAALGNRDAALAALDEAIAANPDEVSLSLMRADLAE
jgi:tetratricopeptide (TPR) repeat protein